jgi:3-oxoacyl-[acyl-carrier protein] reductase
MTTRKLHHYHERNILNMKRLEGKVAIVTGGAKGLGQAMAETFVREGAKVIAADMADLTYQNEHVEGYKLNVTDVEGCKAFFDHVVAKYGRIDILVNNAGITRDSLTAKMSDENWDLVLNVNLKSLFNLTRYVGPYMEQQGSGSIINISSVVGEYGNIGQANYSAAKSAMFGLTKTWAKEFARKGAQVRVNAITPGYTMTDILKTVPEELLKKFAETTMLKRLGEPQDIANAALFLASDEASYVTGHILSVNGGMRL